MLFEVVMEFVRLGELAIAFYDLWYDAELVTKPAEEVDERINDSIWTA